MDRKRGSTLNTQTITSISKLNNISVCLPVRIVNSLLLCQRDARNHGKYFTHGLFPLLLVPQQFARPLAVSVCCLHMFWKLPTRSDRPSVRLSSVYPLKHLPLWNVASCCLCIGVSACRSAERGLRQSDVGRCLTNSRLAAYRR